MINTQLFHDVILGLAMLRGVPAIDELKKGDDEAAKKAAGVATR